MLTRRLLVSALAATPIAACATSGNVKPNIIPADSLRSGDLLFPRGPKDDVPYFERRSGVIARERAAWTATRDEFLSRADAGKTDLPKPEVEQFRSMTYEQFRAVYESPVEEDTRGVGGLSVGHVAIVIREFGKLDVIEALWGNIAKVQRRRYDLFAQSHAGDAIWHSRLKGRSEGERHAMAVEADKYVGRPYDFWNFDLNDDSGFYCSKLVWLATWRALKYSLDGNPNPRRVLWLSPKQLLRQKTLESIFSPGQYLT